MNNILFVFLSLSVSGSILALFLLMLRPLIKNRLGQTWQYYIWLIVILRFLLPFTSQVSVVDELLRNIENISNPPAVVESDPGFGVNEEYTNPKAPDVPQTSQAPAPQNTETETPAQPAYWRDIINNVWMLWIAVALVLFVHKLSSYRSFVRFVKVGAKRITDTRILDIYKAGCNTVQIKKQLPLYINEQVSSPMLVGIMQPMIVIPPLKASDGELQHIFHHELTHYQRQDFIYKWIVQITLCLHWFNPLVYLIGKQINKSCELSCDEAVIKHLDESNRMAYGDALIASLDSQGSYSDFVVSITMSENATLVKERLDAIMKYGKQKKWVVALSVILAVMLFGGGYTLGAYTVSFGTDIPEISGQNISNDEYLSTVSKNVREANEPSELIGMPDRIYIVKGEIERTIEPGTDEYNKVLELLRGRFPKKLKEVARAITWADEAGFNRDMMREEFDFLELSYDEAQTVNLNCMDSDYPSEEITFEMMIFPLSEITGTVSIDTHKTSEFVGRSFGPLHDTAEIIVGLLEFAD